MGSNPGGLVHCEEAFDIGKLAGGQSGHKHVHLHLLSRVPINQNTCGSSPVDLQYLCWFTLDAQSGLVLFGVLAIQPYKAAIGIRNGVLCPGSCFILMMEQREGDIFLASSLWT